ncbi:hypothetical protein E3T61_13220 [Cryobacterium lactosi]|uniref:Uncharacterized protein n=1 Tax=Cryobacterium lactosi TaxID=1259202 RepID=A0A4R9BQU1_9MICO|nr:DUF6264 family protein [Cryobacterium lactosi]TFD88065.1 hypothetical protein E3T61_13220 [Cryobacterium lactosi]
MTMAENAPDQTPATPPVDYRPQPRYGELAPEGWTWTPPQDEHAPADSAVVTPEPVQAPVPPGRFGPGAAPGSVPGSAPTWDRPVTLSLLILGVLGAFFTISILGSMPEALQMLYTQASLGDYTAADSVGSIITAGSIALGVLWLATATVSVMLVLRGRRAFYVPIVGGVVAFVLLVAVTAVVLAGDPALLDYFSRP